MGRTPGAEDQPRHHGSPRLRSTGRGPVHGSVDLLADTIRNFYDALTAVPLWVAFVLVRRALTRR